MTDIDREIEQVLDAEDRILFAQLGEQGIFGQVGSLFQGKLAWFSIVVIVIGIIVTAIGLYAAWKFATVDELTAIVRWGGVAWAAFVTQMMLKIWSWMRMETNRTLREVKRVELQIVRLRAKEAG